VRKISYCIPCYRSQNTVGNVIDEIIRETNKLGDFDYEIICVDDNSPDDVYGVLTKIARENCRVKVVRFAKNFGQQAGLIAAIGKATGDIVVTLDDDGQCPMDHISELIAPLDEGYDISMAKYEHKKQSLFKNFGSKVNDWTEVIMTNKPKGLYMSNFTAMTGFVARQISMYDGPYPSITGLLMRISTKATNVIMKDRERMEGGSTYTLSKLISVWLSGFTTFSIKPLRIATYFGSIIALAGLIYTIVIIITRIVYNDTTEGWSSIMCVLLIIGGITLFVLGIIGEYIGRIYMSINRTPQYIIKDTINLE